MSQLSTSGVQVKYVCSLTASPKSQHIKEFKMLLKSINVLCPKSSRLITPRSIYWGQLQGQKPLKGLLTSPQNNVFKLFLTPKS